MVSVLGVELAFLGPAVVPVASSLRRNHFISISLRSAC